MLLADMDILYSRKIEGGLVIIGFLGGGGGLMLVWEMVENGDGDGGRGEGKSNANADGQNYQSAARP